MKKSMITLAVVLISFTVCASTTSFNSSMKKSLKELRAYSEDISYLKLGDKFAGIAETNPNRFEPLYYSAYSYILASWQVNESSRKKEILSKAKINIDKAIKLSPNNNELLVLEAFYYQAMIMTNPQKYGQSYSAKANGLLVRAQNINDKNPRAEFLLAQNIYYTPTEYGGGKEKALPLFKKAAILFKEQNTSNYLMPIWGEYTNNQMVEKCSK